MKKALCLITAILLLSSGRDGTKWLSVMEEQYILSDAELVGAKKVLSAAAMTYVAATIVALANLLRLIGIARRND